MVRKNNSIGTWIFILIFLVIFFVGPIIGSLRNGGNLFVVLSIVPMLFFFIIIIFIFSAVKSISSAPKKLNNMPGQKINIPVEFFEQGKPVKDSFKEILFSSDSGEKILYYDNGKPVYEHK